MASSQRSNCDKKKEKKMNRAHNQKLWPKERRGFTLYPLVPSADNICKQFGLSSSPTESRACSKSKLFDTLMVTLFLKEFIEKVDFKKISRLQKKHTLLHNRQRIKFCEVSNNKHLQNKNVVRSVYSNLVSR